MKLRLALMLAAVALPAAADDRVPAFAKCYACHSTDPALTDLPGPNLHGVIGRRAGSLPSFRYTPAMRAAGERGLVWSPEQLDRYLADPDAMVPGTSMNVLLDQPAERQAAIAHLGRR
jgi:cytochrome c